MKAKEIKYSFLTEAEALTEKPRLEKIFNNVSDIWKHNRSCYRWMITVVYYDHSCPD